MMRVSKTFSAPLHLFDVVDEYARERQLRGNRPTPLGTVHFFLLAEVLANGEQKPFAHPLELLTRQNSSGYYLYFGDVRFSDGDKRRSHLGDLDKKDQKRYLLHVESNSYQTVECILTHPMLGKEPTQIILLPNVAYPFPSRGGLLFLQGTLRDANGKPLVETAVYIDPPNATLGTTYLLDKSGWWLAQMAPLDTADFDNPRETAVKLHFKLPTQGTVQDGQPFDLSKLTLSAYYGLPHSGPQASDVADPTTATTISTVQVDNAEFRQGDGSVEKNGRWEIPIAHA
ncbi:MAG: hypothetical protein AAF614_44805, partial [Chloroflexota bacterium]